MSRTHTHSQYVPRLFSGFKKSDSCCGRSRIVIVVSQGEVNVSGIAKNISNLKKNLLLCTTSAPVVHLLSHCFDSLFIIIKMPSIKQKFAGFLRQISNPSGAENVENSNTSRIPNSESNTGCFIQRYLNGESRLKQPDILFGRTGQELPCLRLCPLQSETIAAHTGPTGGLLSVNRGQKKSCD